MSEQEFAMSKKKASGDKEVKENPIIKVLRSYMFYYLTQVIINMLMISFYMTMAFASF